MRVLVVGDSHCNRTWWSKAVWPAARLLGVEAILSVGDFGYWPGHDEGRDFLDLVAAGCTQLAVPLVFVDGNHEQHDVLGTLGSDGGPIEVASGIHYAPRGSRWTWDGVRFGALGGAVSPDRGRRREGWDWFAAERITEPDVAAFKGERLDVLVTHDAPSWIMFDHPMQVDPDVARDSLENRHLVDQAIEMTVPRLVVHGHWHSHHRTDYGTGPMVLGLAGDDAANLGDAIALIDTRRLDELDG